MKWMKLTVLTLLGLDLAKEAAAFCQQFSHCKGEGGHFFTTGENWSGVKSVTVSAGEYVDSVKLNFVDGESAHAGGNGGEVQTFVVPENDRITMASVWASRGTNAVQFHTTNGMNSRVFGDRSSCNFNDLTVLTAPPGDELVGMHGRAGTLIDKIAFEWGNCEKAAEELKLMRQSELKEKLQGILTAMQEGDLVLDDEVAEALSTFN